MLSSVNFGRGPFTDFIQDSVVVFGSHRNGVVS